MTISELIQDLSHSAPSGLISRWQNGDTLPVVFNGAYPRVIGWANCYSQADDCAFLARVSATFCSRAQVKLADGRMSHVFFIMHNGPAAVA
jgi:hypothetical protein